MFASPVQLHASSFCIDIVSCRARPFTKRKARKGHGQVRRVCCTISMNIWGKCGVTNYHKTRIRSIALITLLSQFAPILENEVEKKFGVTLDETQLLV